MVKHSLPVEKLKASKTKPIPVKIVNEAPSYVKEDQKWRAEDALRTVKEYKRICSDKSLMKNVKALAKEEMNKLKNI